MIVQYYNRTSRYRQIHVFLQGMVKLLQFYGLYIWYNILLSFLPYATLGYPQVPGMVLIRADIIQYMKQLPDMVEILLFCFFLYYSNQHKIL